MFVVPSIVWAQGYYSVEILGEQPLKAKKIEQRKFKDSLELLAYVEDLRLKDISKGHVLANIDSVQWNDKHLRLFYYRGNVFENLEIFTNEDDEELIRKIPGISEKFLLNLHFDGKELSSVLQKILKYLENHGYPFSSVELDNVNQYGNGFSAELSIEKGPFVSISEIELKGDANVAKKYISNYIDIKEGDAYKELALRDITQRLAQIPFLAEIKTHEIKFTPDGSTLYLYLKSNPVSLINGIAGIQQDPSSDKTIITGDIRLKLQNTLKRGELLALNWRSLQPATQELNVDFNFPFLFNTPFGLQSSFELYKQDSSFLTTKARVGVQYFLTGGNYLNAFYERDNSSVLRTNVLNNNLGNVSTNRYGLGFYRRRLDYIPNPSKGLIIESEAALGRRESRANDSAQVVVSTTLKVDLSVDAYLPITRRNVLRLYAKAESYYADEVFENEQFRFGGLNSQRGFNEQSLLATTYMLLRAEYRFLLDKNSHLFAFYDQSFYENTTGKYYQDDPFGFGAGFSFGSKLGIFSISYALGKQYENPIQLRDGKVHFGYIAYF